MQEGECDRAVRLINERRVYPNETAVRASKSPGFPFVVLLRDDTTGAQRQVDWSEGDGKKDR